MLHKKGGDNKEGSNAFISNTNCKVSEINVEQGRVGNNIKYNQILNILFSVHVAYIIPSIYGEHASMGL